MLSGTHNYWLAGIGHSLVDLFLDESSTSNLRDSFLNPYQKLNSTDLRDIEENGRITQSLAGGSVANSIRCFSCLGGSSCFIGSVGDDDLSEIFVESFSDKVEFIGEQYSQKKTGRSYILVDEKGEKRMATYHGASELISYTMAEKALEKTEKCFFIEGYLFSNPHTTNHVILLAKKAKSLGLQVALSLSDSRLVSSHRESFSHLIYNYVDILFANESEMATLLDGDSVKDLQNQRAFKYLIITKGSRGSSILGEDLYSEITMSGSIGLDTTAAGDIFAGAFLFGLLNGDPIKKCHNLACKLAEKSISYSGSAILRDPKSLFWN